MRPVGQLGSGSGSGSPLGRGNPEPNEPPVPGTHGNSWEPELNCPLREPRQGPCRFLRGESCCARPERLVCTERVPIIPAPTARLVGDQGGMEEVVLALAKAEEAAVVLYGDQRPRALGVMPAGGTAWLVDLWACRDLGALLWLPPTRLVGFSLKRALPWLFWLFGQGVPVFDVQLAAVVLEGHELSLEQCAEAYLCRRLVPAFDLRWAGHLSSRHCRQAYRDLEPILALKGAQQRLARLDDLEECLSLEQAVLPVVAEMESVGMPLNPAAWHDEVAAALLELRCDGALLSASGVETPLDARRTQPALSSLLGRELAATNEVALRPHADSSAVRALTRYRSNAAFVGTFQTPIEAQLRRGDTRIRPTWSQLGTTTGRITAANPPLLALPRTRRHVFEAPDGCVFVEADYSAIDLRVVAEVSRDPTLVRVACAGEDLHRHVASVLTGKPPAAVTKAERNANKPIAFGAVYGMGAATLAEYAGCNSHGQMTIDEAGDLLARFFGAHPGVAAWHAYMRGADPREVRSLSGRVRRFPPPGGSFNERLAAVGQGTTADGMKQALVLMREPLALLGARLVAVVYDAVLVEAPLPVAEEARDVVTGAMREGMGRFLRSVPTEVHTSIKSRWA